MLARLPRRCQCNNVIVAGIPPGGQYLPAKICAPSLQSQENCPNRESSLPSTAAPPFRSALQHRPRQRLLVILRAWILECADRSALSKRNMSPHSTAPVARLLCWGLIFRTVLLGKRAFQGLAGGHANRARLFETQPARLWLSCAHSSVFPASPRSRSTKQTCSRAPNGSRALRHIGLDARVCPTNGHPIVLARTPRTVRPASRTSWSMAITTCSRRTRSTSGHRRHSRRASRAARFLPAAPPTTKASTSRISKPSKPI